MKRRVLTQRAGSKAAWLAVICALIVIFAVAGVTVGARSIDFGVFWQALTRFDPENTEHVLIVQMRIPRSLLAIAVGICLGAAGTVMQAMTRNPLAEPGLLGVNGGAAAAIAVGIAVFGLTSVTAYMWLGMIGAALAGTGVYLLGGVRRGTHPIRLVLAGTALSVVLLALTQILLLNSVEQVFDRYRNWIVGSVAGRGYDVLTATAILALIGFVMAFALVNSLNTVALGEDLGRSLGTNVLRTWSVAGLAVIVLSGAATAAAGPITFLGLAAPHLARLLVGVDHKWVLPFSSAIAALLLLVADILGRLVAPPAEISVGIMVAILGGPFFVHLVRTRKMAQL